MQRLFLAIPFSESVTSRLQLMQPPLGSRVRVVPPEQLHLTLHFIGPARIGTVVDAIRDVEFAPFELSMQRVGHFESRDGGLILWVGVNTCPPLLRLYSTLGERLQALGIRLDERPYAPHITLARGPRSDLQTYVEAASRHERQVPIPVQQVTEYCLYSSTLFHAGPVYQVEHRFKCSPEEPSPAGR